MSIFIFFNDLFVIIILFKNDFLSKISPILTKIHYLEKRRPTFVHTRGFGAIANKPTLKSNNVDLMVSQSRYVKYRI